jgi:hypothetical protein
LATVPINFTDDDGVVWDVWEVTRTRAAPGHSAASDGPSFGDPPVERMLCFLSQRGKRRLDTYPRFWSVLSRAAFQRLCQMAQAVAHADIRPTDDPGAEAMLADSSDARQEGHSG